MGYKNFVKHGDRFLANKEAPEVEKLEPGCYNAHHDFQFDMTFFEPITFKHDDLLELPSKAFQSVVTQIDTFLEPSTKQAFKDYGFLYKRSTLMYGQPGTGKTCLVNRIANKVVNQGGIVLFNPHPGELQSIYKVLDDVQPETMVLVVFEEIDSLVPRLEGYLLNILDGEIQKENVMYLATTNFIDRIPSRLLRPGRLSSVIEVGFPEIEEREFYLNAKIGHLDDQKTIHEMAKRTENLSIDELKEVVSSTKCLKIDLDEVLERIYKVKGLSFNSQAANNTTVESLDERIFRLNTELEAAYTLSYQEGYKGNGTR